jgi:hypothetical protein
MSGFNNILGDCKPEYIPINIPRLNYILCICLGAFFSPLGKLDVYLILIVFIQEGRNNNILIKRT